MEGAIKFKQGLLEYRAKKVTRGESFHRAEQDILRTGVGSLASAKNSTLTEYLTYQNEHWNLFRENGVIKSRLPAYEELGPCIQMRGM